MRILRQIWDDIRHGENIDLYLTILIAIPLAALNLIGLASQSLTTSIILVRSVYSLFPLSPTDTILGK